jgi:hypothetical protein
LTLDEDTTLGRGENAKALTGETAAAIARRAILLTVMVQWVSTTVGKAMKVQRGNVRRQAIKRASVPDLEL